MTACSHGDEGPTLLLLFLGPLGLRRTTRRGGDDRALAKDAAAPVQVRQCMGEGQGRGVVVRLRGHRGRGIVPPFTCTGAAGREAQPAASRDGGFDRSR